MNVAQLFKDLAYGELSNTAYADEDAPGTILESRKPAVVGQINEALLRLYSKFVLKERDLVVEMQEGITNYHLIKRFALQSYDPLEEQDPYIIDLPLEPYKEDLIRITSVYNSYGIELPLNDAERPNSLFTPQLRVLQVPRPIPGASLSVSYQCMHETITGEDDDQVIELPEVLHSALRAFVAAKILGFIGTAEASAKGQEHMINYENLVREVEDRDAVSTSVSTTNSKFEKRGWA